MTEKVCLHPNPPHSPEATFDAFEPFIKVEDPELRRKFTNLLRELHQLTGFLWRPGNCYGAEGVEKLIKQSKRSGESSGISLTTKNYVGGSHYYFEAEIDGTILIVDPFGVPTPGQNYYSAPRTITPFFGELSQAPEHHRRIYETGKNNSEVGYRRFRP